MFEAGRGAGKDEGRAVALHDKACDAGSATGCFNLGVMFHGSPGAVPAGLDTAESSTVSDPRRARRGYTARPVDSVMDRIEAMIAWFRQRRWAHLAVVNLRILIGFAFLPAGLKKILGEPFTDPGNRGPFHEFLHAFHATGHFYTFVGVVQLVAAMLLMTQRFATAGAFLALPVTGAILAFCWSTAAVPTATVVTLMFAGLVGLALWDVARWRGVLDAPDATPRAARASSPALIDLRLWSLCGAAILAAYLATCLLGGGVYRPRGPAFDEPGFYVLMALPLFPIVTALIDRRRRAGR